MDEKNELNITPLKDLISYSEGSIVELPPFAEGQRFIAKLKRPSLLLMIEKGQIPNQLLKIATELFGGKVKYEDKDEGSMMKDVLQVLKIMCESSFVSPTYKELTESGIELTDNQMMFIFNYSQTGVKALEQFR